MKKIQGTKTFISSSINIADIQPVFIQKVIDLFKKEGIDLPGGYVELGEGDYEFYLDLKCFDDAANDPQDAHIASVAKKIGFSEVAYENATFIAKRIFGAPADITLDPRSSVAVFEFHDESHNIMNGIQDIYLNVNEMTADETKDALAKLYVKLRDSYGWEAN